MQFCWHSVLLLRPFLRTNKLFLTVRRRVPKHANFVSGCVFSCMGGTGWAGSVVCTKCCRNVRTLGVLRVVFCGLKARPADCYWERGWNLMFFQRCCSTWVIICLTLDERRELYLFGALLKAVWNEINWTIFEIYHEATCKIWVCLTPLQKAVNFSVFLQVFFLEKRLECNDLEAHEKMEMSLFWQY